MLGDRRFIQSIKLQNFLSFGPDAGEIELKSLNVLIGPNASGPIGWHPAKLVFWIPGNRYLHTERAISIEQKGEIR